MTTTTHLTETTGSASRPQSRRAPIRSVLAPSPQQCVPVWDRRVPLHPNLVGGRPPLLWLLGAHGGAGTTSLERLLAPAADCHRRWPAPIGEESPYVLVVARETAVGLAAADVLLRQYHAGLGGDTIVVGLVTVAARPGRIPAQIRRDRDLYGGLVDNLWHVDWHEAWIRTSHAELPVWTPGDSDPGKQSRTDELGTAPPEVRDLGRDLIAAITAIHHDRNVRIGEPP